MDGKKGFSLVELMVVVAIIALLITILIPTLTRAEEQARQAKCQANMKGVGLGWIMYARGNNAIPPMLSGTTAAGAYEDALRMGSNCTAADLGTGAQQNLCLLVKIDAVPWGMFICPSTGNKEADRRGSGKQFGLGDGDMRYCDYAVQILDRNSGNLCKPQHMDGAIAIVGDQPPKYRVTNFNLMTMWSPNHPDYGESLLFAGGNVRFSKDKSEDTSGLGRNRNTGGWGGNNIYTQDAWDDGETQRPTLTYNRRLVGLPNSTKDSVLFAYGQAQE